MALLLETSLGDITIDLDVEGSPKLCFNLLKLAKARYFTNSLVYNVQPGRFCQMGDPRGDGSGGRSIYGLINENDETSRFIKSRGRRLTKQELLEKGRVVAIEMGGLKDTVGSQFMITIDSGKEKALDGIVNLTSEGGHVGLETHEKEYLSLGVVVMEEDEDDVLDKFNGLYCDKHGRPYADVRIHRAHILDDPFDEDPIGMERLMEKRRIALMEPGDLPQQHKKCARWLSSSSPCPERPKEEVVEERISTEEALAEVDEETERKREKRMAEKEDRSNAVMLEMLGDISSADMKPPENVLFVCKLNPLTDEEDLQLIFSRFDPNAKAEIIRDQETGDSLQYAFVEFDTEKACNEAYFKMNNALVDDRRIKVDFSQSVAKEWSKYTQMKRGIYNLPYPDQRSTQRNIKGSESQHYIPRQMNKQFMDPRNRNSFDDLKRRQNGGERYGYDEDHRKRDRSMSDASNSNDKERCNSSARRNRDERRERERKRSSHRRRDRQNHRNRDDSEEREKEWKRRCKSDKHNRRAHRSRSEEHERYRRKTSKRKSSRDSDRKKAHCDRRRDRSRDRGRIGNRDENSKL